MPWDTGLTGVTREIAGTDDSPLRVMAGPGTGKSFVLKRRVARLLEQGVEPTGVLAVTFTRNAANSLVDDLQSLGVEGCDRIRAGTLHSFCYSLLMNREVLNTLGRFPRPILFFTRSGVMRFEGAPLITDILRDTNYGTQREATTAIRAFEAAWAKLQSDEPGWALEDADRAFHDTLISWLTFHKAVLIGELIPLALQYLRDNPACPERHTFEHVLVDEYQDLNKAEQVLIDILAEPCNHLLVGDADQSIYSFRFAHPEGITNFGDTHPGTHDEILTDCRRCPTVVVELADHLIRANYPAEEPRRLNTFEGNPVGQVAIVQWQSMQEEAEGITEFCQYLANHAGYEPQDILILCPRRLIGYGIRDALRNSGIAAHSYYYEEAFEPTEAQINFCLLSINCNNDDCVALRYWLGFGSNSWNARGYKILREHCEMTDHSTYQTMQELMAGDLQLPYTKPLIERFSLLQDELAALIDLRGYELLDRLFPEGQEWCNVLRDAALARIDEETEPQDLLDLLRTQITQPEMPEEGDFARVMSLHKSKGLTSRVVIVAGCIEGLCPTYADNLDQVGLDAAIKEQRRLFFVAITRCQEILVLSSVIALEKRIAYKMGAQVRGRGLVGSTVATRFINDLGPTAPRSITGARWIANGFQ